ncbi:MAG: arginase family protein [Microbacteriaceae bacterium]
MALSTDPNWPRSGDWPAPDGTPVDLALVGLPTFSTSLSPNSAFTTPSAVRNALRYYSDYTTADRGVRAGSTTGLRYADFGDAADPDADEAGAISLVARAAAAARLVIALGGDNAATVPAAMGTWGDRITTAGLITLDAHHDLRDGVSNGSPVRRLIEAGLAGTRVVQIGIADFANSAFYAERAADYGITVIHRDELHRRPMTDIMAEALEIAGSAAGPVHLDVDVDVCDRAVAPACPASIPGGIAAHELRSAVRAAGLHPTVESIDITEVDATADAPDQRTVRLVALGVLEAAAGLEQRA